MINDNGDNFLLQEDLEIFNKIVGFLNKVWDNLARLQTKVAHNQAQPFQVKSKLSKYPEYPDYSNS